MRHLDVPLERDEGEYAYSAQLILEGIAPFAQAANMKLPGASLAYSVFIALFGASAFAVHLGLLLTVSGSTTLVFLLARRFFDTRAAGAAAATFALLSVQQCVMGLWAHATHFVVLAALGGLLLLLKWQESGRRIYLLLSGVLFGLSFLMKQPAAFFCLFGAGWLAWTGRNRMREMAVNLALFTLAGATPLMLLCLAVWSAGAWDRFWFWTVTYGSQYASVLSWTQGRAALSSSFGAIASANWLLLLLSAAGLVRLWRSGLDRRTATLLSAWLAASLLAVVPGFYFRPHYFVVLLPAVSLLVGAFAHTWPKSSYGWAPPVAAAAALVWVAFGQWQWMFVATPFDVARSTYGLNPFPEAAVAGAHIREHASPGARLAVLGSEPEIYFYARRRAATSALYVYPLMEPHPFAAQMQKEFIREIETATPEYVVMVTESLSWLATASSSRTLLDWWTRYGPAHYSLEGIVNAAPDGSFPQWLPAAQASSPSSPSALLVYRRRGGTPTSVP